MFFWFAYLKIVRLWTSIDSCLMTEIQLRDGIITPYLVLVDHTKVRYVCYIQGSVERGISGLKLIRWIIVGVCWRVNGDRLMS